MGKELEDLKHSVGALRNSFIHSPFRKPEEVKKPHCVYCGYETWEPTCGHCGKNVSRPFNK